MRRAAVATAAVATLVLIGTGAALARPAHVLDGSGPWASQHETECAGSHPEVSEQHEDADEKDGPNNQSGAQGEAHEAGCEAELHSEHHSEQPHR